MCFTPIDVKEFPRIIDLLMIGQRAMWNRHALPDESPLVLEANVRRASAGVCQMPMGMRGTTRRDVWAKSGHT